MSSSAKQDEPGGNGLKLVLAWSFVGIPLIWGVLHTLSNAMLLFK